jgi:hypothetical protein
MKTRGVVCALGLLCFIVFSAFPSGCGLMGTPELDPTPLFGDQASEDDVEDPRTPENDPGNEPAESVGPGMPPVYLETIEVGCFAFDDECQPIAGVTVTSGKGDGGVTNSEGFCSLSIGTQADKVLIKFQMDGYATDTKFINLLAGDAPFADIVLKAEPNEYSLDTPGEGGTVVFDQGSITFSPNTFKDPESPEMKKVFVKVDTLDVTGNDILNAPGDFSALTQEGEAVWLETFGMVSVKVTNSFGQKVQFAKGAKVNLELLVPQGVEFEIGTEVPSWHYDASKNKWVEEGKWTAKPWSQDPRTTAFSTTVKHFSWWNIDYPMQVTCIQGTVKLCNGRPAMKTQVLATGHDYFTVLSDITNDSGEFCILAKVNSTVTISTTIFDGTALVTASAEVETPLTPALCGEGDCIQVDLKLPCEGDPGYGGKKILCSR